MTSLFKLYYDWCDADEVDRLRDLNANQWGGGLLRNIDRADSVSVYNATNEPQIHPHQSVYEVG